METEKMKMKAGKLYDANYDKELLAERAACADLTYELNQLRPSKAEERDALVRRILGKVKGNCTIVSPFATARLSLLSSAITGITSK